MKGGLSGVCRGERQELPIALQSTANSGKKLPNHSESCRNLPKPAEASAKFKELLNEMGDTTGAFKNYAKISRLG